MDGDVPASDERVVLSHNLDELKRTMWDYVRNRSFDQKAGTGSISNQEFGPRNQRILLECQSRPFLLEVRNLVCVAELIIRSALRRKESRGLHYTLDYPDMGETLENTLVRPLKR